MTRNQLLDEIHRLIDDQMKTLQSRLTNDEALEYSSRRNRIAELLDELNRRDLQPD